jgi:hypothetical protein
MTEQPEIQDHLAYVHQKRARDKDTADLLILFFLFMIVLDNPFRIFIPIEC